MLYAILFRSSVTRRWSREISAVLDVGDGDNNALVVESRRPDQTLRKTRRDVPVRRISVTAFLKRAEFRKWVAQIVWKTELAESPDRRIVSKATDGLWSTSSS